MKERLKILSVALVVLSLSLSTVSCSGDNDEVNDSSIVGAKEYKSATAGYGFVFDESKFDGYHYFDFPSTIYVDQYDREVSIKFSSWSGENFYPDWEECEIQGIMASQYRIEHYPEGEYMNTILTLNLGSAFPSEFTVHQINSGMSQFVQVWRANVTRACHAKADILDRGPGRTELPRRDIARSRIVGRADRAVELEAKAQRDHGLEIGFLTL